MKFHFIPIRSVKRKREVNTVLTAVTHNEGKGKGKVKFTLKQATKAQSGSRDIALLLF